MSLNIDFPDFNHPEVRAFYEYDLSIPKEKVEEILQLPRETLIEDMETMLMDTIQRDEFFRNWEDKDQWWSFHFHALWVLVELEAVESFPTLIKLIQQDEEFCEYWWVDYMADELWEMYYYLAGNKLDELKEVLFAPGYWLSRIIPSTLAEQIYLRHPERHQEILDWYDSVLDAFLAMKDDGEAIDPEVLSFVVGDLVAIKAAQLLPKIRAVYKRKLVYPYIIGSIESIEADIQDPKNKDEKRNLKQSIYDRYEEAMRWAGYQMKYNREAYEKEEAKRFSKLSIPTPKPIQKSEKVGRNAPCPCGSGKKYKKCCLK